MQNVKQEAGRHHVLAEIRKNFNSKKRLTVESPTTTKRYKITPDDEDDATDVHTNLSTPARRVAEPPSQSRRGSGTIDIANPQASSGPITAGYGHSSPTGPSISNAEIPTPTTRLTTNGATLYTCSYPGCGKTCRTVERLKSHAENTHTQDVRPSENHVGQQEAGASSAMIQTKEKDPTSGPPGSKSKESSVSPTKLRRRPNWQRADDVLRIGPDMRMVSPSHFQQESQRRVWQSANEHREGPEIVYQTVSSPCPRPDYSRSSTEELILRESLNQLEVPLQCPVIMCEKLFHFRDDFEYHKAQAHRGQRLSINDDGSFAVLDPKTNEPSQDISYGTFICENCEECFNGWYGLAFHKSRSPKCGTLSETHPALLAYKPAEGQSLPNEADPINTPEVAENPSRKQTRVTIRKGGKSLGSSVQEVTGAVRCEQENLASNTEVGGKINSAAGQRISKISEGIPLEDLGLSSDSSNDEDLMLSTKNHLRPEPDTKFQSGVRQMSSTKAKITRINEKDTKLLFAAEAVVEARFARVKYTMIAEVMRANGAEEYKADLIEKELPRLNKLASPYAKSGEDPLAASRPAGEKVKEITAGIEAQISAHFMEQTKALSAANREELDETLGKLREDINGVKVAILERVEDVFRPDTLKSNHCSENLDYRKSDRASQTKAQPQEALLCQNPNQQSPQTPIQQHRVPEQYSAIRSVKESESTAKEDGLALASRISPGDQNIDSTGRMSSLPYDQDTDPVRQISTSYLHGDKFSQRKDPAPYEQATDRAKETNTIINCRKCSKTFDSYDSLRSHLRSGSHFGPFPPLVIGSKSTAAATKTSAKPRAQGQREMNREGPGLPSLYRPSKSTETNRGPPQMDGARDMVGSNPDPKAQLLPQEILSPILVNRANQGHKCRVCHESFEFRPQLYRHLKEENHQRTKDDQVWHSTIPTGPKKTKKFNQTGSEKKSQGPGR